MFGDRARDVVFISNAARATAMWSQRAAGARGSVIVWDYHVIVLAHDPPEIWDLDTFLPFPSPAAIYLARSFHPGVPALYAPLFRVVDHRELTATFASDRSHMVRPDGRYRRPPPPWPLIGAPDREPNLMRFVDVTTPYRGEVIDLATLRARVAG